MIIISQPVYLLGDGDLARELKAYLFNEGYEVKLVGPKSTLSDDVFKATAVKRDVNCLVAVGDPKIRKALYESFHGEEYMYLRYIHPIAVIGSRAMNGLGTVIGPGAIIGNDVLLFENSIVLANATIGHNTAIGMHSVIGPGAIISGRCEIGKEVRIGTGASIKQGVTIGDGATVGMGAVVIKDVLAHKVVVGVPADRTL